MWRNCFGRSSFLFVPIFVVGILVLLASAHAGQPAADFSADPTRGPMPLTVHFTSAANEEYLIHDWDFGDGEESRLPNPRHTYTRPGIYTVKHTVKSPTGEDTEIKNNLIRSTDYLNLVFGLLLDVFPEIWPSRTVHNFSQVRPGSKARWSFTLSNLSDKAFQITGVSGLPENGFRLAEEHSMPLELEAYGSLEISVTFEPETAGFVRATATIHTNSPLSPRIVIALSGRALNYHIRDLGISDATFSTAVAVNNSGEVLAHGRSTVGGFRSFFWEPVSGLRDISAGLPGFSFPRDMNNLGLIVGAANGRGFIWSPNEGAKMIPTEGDSRSVCHAINDLGQVVGTIKALDHGLQHSAFLCRASEYPVVLHEILPLQSEHIENMKIGNSGTVIGTMVANSNSEAFIWEADRGMQSLGSLGGSYSEAADINDLGNVVGASTFQGEESIKHAFVWNRSEGMKSVIKPRPGVSTYPAAVNNRNEIVGYFKDEKGRGETAFLYKDGIHYYLSLSIPRKIGWGSIERAYDINDHGQIVGFGKFNGEARAFLMTPAPLTEVQTAAPRQPRPKSRMEVPTEEEFRKQMQTPVR